MARYTEQIQLDKPEEFVLSVMNNYLQKNGFIMSDLKSESVYRAGDRYSDGYRYLKWSYVNGVLKLEAWIQGPFGMECNFNGFLHYDRKVLYKHSLEKLIAKMQEKSPTYTASYERCAWLAFATGVLAFICFNPIICIIFAPVSVTLARIGLRSNRAGWAKAGRICAIVSLLTTSIVSFMNLYIQFI